MGLLDIFSKEARIQRTVKKLANKWVHMDERRSAIESLRAYGTDEAIQGLLQRFNFVIDNTTVDEDEKQSVADALVEFGERSIPQVIAYLRKAETMTWALKVLQRIETTDRVVAHLVQLVKEIDPLDKKSGKRQEQLILELSDLHDDRVVEALLPLLAEDNGDVRFHAVEALEKLGDARAAAPLLELAVKDESIRLRGRALQAIAKNRWPVGKARDSISSLLPPNHYIGPDGIVHNRLQEVYNGLQAADAKDRRFAAREAALLSKPDEAMEALIEALADSEAAVRAAVCATLAKVGDWRAVDPLQKLMSDKDADVRKRAEEALRRVRN